MHGRGLLVGLALALAGCGDPDVSSPNAAEPLPGDAFDPTHCGHVRGRVTWAGEPPRVAPFDVHVNALGGPIFHHRHERPNPHAPRIDSASQGLADAVVFLRGVELSKARPWDHPPLHVELVGCSFQLKQGDGPSHVGFVRRGDMLSLTSRDDVFHSVHADGAAFFTLTFPERAWARQRCLNGLGIVELSSASGYFWMRGYVFVMDHPYVCRTDAKGAFMLPEVPAGAYELVCWLPNWRKQRHERDPETGEISRVYYHAAIERTAKVQVRPGEASNVELVVAAPREETLEVRAR
jgi:hypothetical protein